MLYVTSNELAQACAGHKSGISSTIRKKKRHIITLGNTANAIGYLMEGWLAEFFKRLRYKKGRPSAVSALARKLAVIIWNMLVKNQAYNPPSQYLFLDEKRKMAAVKRIQKQITKFGLTDKDINTLTNRRSMY